MPHKKIFNTISFVVKEGNILSIENVYKINGFEIFNVKYLRAASLKKYKIKPLFLAHLFNVTDKNICTKSELNILFTSKVIFGKKNVEGSLETNVFRPCFLCVYMNGFHNFYQ